MMLNRNQRKKSKFLKQAVKKFNNKLNYDFFQQRKQGFQVQQVMKSALNLIRRQTQKLNINSQLIDIQDQDKNKVEILIKNERKKTQKRRKKPLLPELVEYINQINAQNNNELIKFERRKIIHLLILGINRRNVQKIKQGLDIILEASSYLNKDKQQFSLHINSLNLIYKFYKQYQNKIKYNKSKDQNRRKSMILRNIASEQNFIINFRQKFRKTKLIKQLSYSNTHKTNSQNFVKINAKFSAYIPQTNQIFPSKYTNYDFVAITIDDKNNLFPYQYPKTVSQHISKSQYRYIISKFNSILFKQRQCYDWDSILRLYFIDIFIIFLCFSIYILLGIIKTSQTIKTIFFILIIIIFIIVSIHITGDQNAFKSYIQIHQRIQRFLIQLQQKYQQKNIKFRLSKTNIAIFIVIPIQKFQQQSQISQESIIQNSQNSQKSQKSQQRQKRQNSQNNSRQIIQEQRNKSFCFSNEQKKYCFQQQKFQNMQVSSHEVQKSEFQYEIFIPTLMSHQQKNNDQKLT